MYKCYIDRLGSIRASSTSSLGNPTTSTVEGLSTTTMEASETHKSEAPSQTTVETSTAGNASSDPDPGISRPMSSMYAVRPTDIEDLGRERQCFTPRISNSDGGHGRQYVSERRVLLVGQSGSGKSSTGNTLVAKHVFTATPGAESVTKKCEFSSCNYGGNQVIAIDTPGLFDTNISKDDMELELTKCLTLAAPGPHAILVVIPVNARFKTEVIESYLQLFGSEVIDRILLVFTKTDTFTEDITNEQAFLKNASKELKSLIERVENRFVFVNNRAVGDKENERRKLFHAIDELISSCNGNYFTSKAFEILENKRIEVDDELMAVREDLEINSSDMTPSSSLTGNTVSAEHDARNRYRQHIRDDNEILLRFREILNDFLEIFFALVNFQT